jgi:CsoR family transcriptional regulator, copper-sensing transcriptional repressor
MGIMKTKPDENPTQGTRHDADLDRLARIEGQVRGVRRMVEEGAYCIDILRQVQAARAALQSVSRRILRRHLEHCVADALSAGAAEEAEVKIEELMDVIARTDR